MVDERLENEFRKVTAAATELLKPLGFKKRGRTLYRSSDRNLALVEFQRSTTNARENLKLTVNVGIVSGYLANRHELDLRKAGAADAHLRTRIGTFLSEPHDKWWELHASENSDVAIAEILTLLKHRVVPYLDAHTTDDALIALWETGQSPGLTSTLRTRYLAELMERA